MNNAVAKLRSTMIFVALAAGSALAIACAEIPANDPIVVKTVVKYGDLNLEGPDGTVALYRRLKYASRNACHQLELKLVDPRPDYFECVENALGNAVYEVNRVSLTRVYLGDHSAAIATKYGIEAPVRYATK
ncbi:MAG TPA: UrcA family protein [Steroidobacteraceae bacterium]